MHPTNMQRKLILTVQDLKSKNVTLDGYTSAILNSYANTSGVKVLESSATTLAGQPAHKIVLTDDRVDSLKLKKMQVWSVINKSKAYLATFAAEESKYQGYLPQFQNILNSLAISSSSDNPQEKTELPFDDPISGIKLQYPPLGPRFRSDNRHALMLISLQRFSIRKTEMLPFLE